MYIAIDMKHKKAKNVQSIIRKNGTIICTLKKMVVIMVGINLFDYVVLIVYFIMIVLS